MLAGMLAACGGGGGGNEIKPFESLNGFVVADLDGDGRSDLAATVVLINGADFPGKLRVWLQRHDGSGQFDAPVDIATAAYPNPLLRADIDGDGRPDLVTASNSPGGVLIDTLAWLRASLAPPGRFEATTPLRVGTRISHLAAGDLDRDGRIDLVITTYDQRPGVAVLWGEGGGSFSAPVYLRAGEAASDVAVSDVNADGWPDLVFSDGDAIGLLLHEAAPRAFQAAVAIAAGRNTTFVAVADFDRDGLPDIAYGDRDTTDVGAPGVMVLLRNDPAQPGRFAERQRQALAVHSFDAHAVDMNRDGWPDLVVAEPNVQLLNPSVDMVEVFLGRPDAAGLLAAPVQNRLQDISAYFIGVGDVDGDGRPDVLAGPMGVSQGRLAWLRQDPARPGTLLPPVLLP